MQSTQAEIVAAIAFYTLWLAVLFAGLMIAVYVSLRRRGK